MNKKTFLVLVLVFAFLAIFIIWVAPRSPVLFGMIEFSFGPIIPASSYAHNLDSTDVDLQRESFYFLTQRGDPIAVPRAIQLLQSPDDYVWLNAAIYLGKCNRPEAIPYLIKALRHQASRSYDDEAGYLRDLTGQDFGTDFPKWQKWWLSTHPDSKIDWTSHLNRLASLATSGT